MKLLLVSPTDAHAGTARRTAPTRWSVPLVFDGPDGSPHVTLAVDVVRNPSGYLVC